MTLVLVDIVLVGVDEKIPRVMPAIQLHVVQLLLSTTLSFEWSCLTSFFVF